MSLVITRKSGQKVLVGENIYVTVGRVFADGRVRLCIDAPKDVKVAREELLTKENK